MLHHNTADRLKKAFAIQLYRGDTPEWLFRNFFNMTLVFARSLREAGYSEDIIAVTDARDIVEELTDKGVKVEIRELFDYPALHQWKCPAHQISIFDMNKAHYWSLVDYDRIIGIDNDMLVGDEPFTDWDNPNVVVSAGFQSPINSGIILLRPSSKIYNNILKIAAASDFCPKTGWNNCGNINVEGNPIENWSFQAANAFQGFLPYYFRSLKTIDWNPYFKHFPGNRKYTDPEYLEKCEEYGLPLTKPRWVSDA